MVNKSDGKNAAVNAAQCTLTAVLINALITPVQAIEELLDKRFSIRRCLLIQLHGHLHFEADPFRNFVKELTLEDQYVNPVGELIETGGGRPPVQTALPDTLNIFYDL